MMLFTCSGQSTSIPYVCHSRGCEIKNEIKIANLADEHLKVFRNWSLETVQSLLNKNVEYISGISLKTLSAEILTVNWQVLSQGYLAPQGRLSGFMYKVETKTVYVELDTLKELIENQALSFAIPIIFLHESLGALGYLDEDYEISSLFVAIDQLNSIEFENSRFDFTSSAFNVQKRILSPSGPLRPTDEPNTLSILIAGGSTTVGGGGDPLMALLKMRILKLALRKSTTSETLQFITSMRLERPIAYFEKMKTGLVEINRYPLLFEDFVKSIAVTQKEKKTILLINMSETSPLYNIEEHFLNFILNLKLI